MWETCVQASPVPDKPCLHFKNHQYVPVVFRGGDGCMGLGSIPGAGPEFISPAQALRCSRQSQTALSKSQASSVQAGMPELRYLHATPRCMCKSKIGYMENQFQEMCILKASRNGATTFPICKPSHAYPFPSLERLTHLAA